MVIFSIFNEFVQFVTGHILDSLQKGEVYLI